MLLTGCHRRLTGSWQVSGQQQDAKTKHRLRLFPAPSPSLSWHDVTICDRAAVEIHSARLAAARGAQGTSLTWLRREDQGSPVHKCVCDMPWQNRTACMCHPFIVFPWCEIQRWGRRLNISSDMSPYWAQTRALQKWFQQIGRVGVWSF